MFWLDGVQVSTRYCRGLSRCTNNYTGLVVWEGDIEGVERDLPLVIVPPHHVITCDREIGQLERTPSPSPWVKQES